ncbi:MAG: hypothetical protein ACLT8C_04345 [Akkermansia muciniphila]
MIQSTTIAFLSSAFIYFSVCQGDICQINGLSPEDLKNLSYDPPRNELLSEAQDKKAWQTFVETYEVPVGKVQDWYNSIRDKDSADAAADAFKRDVLPILKKLTGRSADIKKQVLAIPASSEMQKLILSRILTLQSRLLIIFLPMQDSKKSSSDAYYHGSEKLFDIFLGLTSTTAMDISNLLKLKMKTRKALKQLSKNHGQRHHLLKKQVT